MVLYNLEVVQNYNTLECTKPQIKSKSLSVKPNKKQDCSWSQENASTYIYRFLCTLVTMLHGFVKLCHRYIYISNYYFMAHQNLNDYAYAKLLCMSSLLLLCTYQNCDVVSKYKCTFKKRKVTVNEKSSLNLLVILL